MKAAPSILSFPAYQTPITKKKTLRRWALGLGCIAPLQYKDHTTMSLINQIKKHFTIASVVAPTTGGLKKPIQTKYGQYYNGWCPFCQSGQLQKGKPRKFWVNVESNLCNCMDPSCASNLPMDVINFYSRYWGVSNREAIEDLAVMMNGAKVVR